MDGIKNYESFDSHVTLNGIGGSVYAVGKGDLSIRFWNGAKWEDGTIQNVLIVPEMRDVTLISAEILISKGFRIDFNENCVRIYHPTRSQSIIGRRKNGLYEMFIQSISCESCYL